MTPAQIAVVQRSFSRVVPVADAVARDFYDALFASDPSLRPMFKGDLGEQRRKLMLTLGTAVQQLHAFDEILPVLRGLAARHVGYGVEARHYDLVGRALIEALGRRLPAFGAEERDAWSAAYGRLAGEMVRVHRAA